MGLFTAKVKAKEISLSLVIIRADGTVEDLGVVDYYHTNPLRRWAFKVRKQLRRRKGA